MPFPPTPLYIFCHIATDMSSKTVGEIHRFLISTKSRIEEFPAPDKLISLITIGQVSILQFPAPLPAIRMHKKAIPCSILSSKMRKQNGGI